MKITLKNKNRECNIKFYAIYTFCFFVLAIIMCLPFWIHGKSLLQNNDIIYQSFNAFLYIGKYIRTIFKTLLFEHRLEIPMWSFSIGQGADILGTLGYYVIGDPLALVSVITPGKYAEVVYEGLIILRLWLAGVTFSMFCRKMRCTQFGTLCGTLAYVFCMHSRVVISQPFFSIPLIFLPLVLLGVEKMLRGERKTLYILAVFGACISNFYFFYMIALVTILYVVVRYCAEVLREGAKKKQVLYGLVECCLKFAANALIGIMMAGVVFVPLALYCLNNARLGNNYTFDLLYRREYYESFPGQFVNAISNEATCMGFSAVVLLGIFSAFIKWKKDIWMKIIFLIMTAGLLFPVVGYMMNGFSYVSNRWVFAYCFWCTFLFAKNMKELFQMTKKQKIALTVCCVMYVLICLVLRNSWADSTWVEMLILILTLIVLLKWPFVCEYYEVESMLHANAFSWKLRCQRKTLAQMMLLFLTIFGSGYLYFTVSRTYQFENYYDNGSISKLLNDEYPSWALIQDDGFYRIDNEGGLLNYPVSGEQSVTSMYWSFVHPDVVSWYQKNSSYNGMLSLFRGMSSRTMLLPFSSSKYLTTYSPTSVPYGYEYEGETMTYSGARIYLYKTDHVLPLGYTNDTYVSMNTYETLSFTERQQAMLQGVVLDDEIPLKELKTENLEFSDKKLANTISCDDSTMLNGNTLIVKEGGGTITIETACPADCELYLQIKGLSFDGGKDITKTAISSFQRGYSSVTHFTKYNQYTHDRRDYLLNLYYSPEERTDMTVTFSEPGIYTFESLELIAQPLNRLEVAVAEMRKDTLKNVEISANTVKGSIALNTDKFLTLSVPYSKGWSAIVDGQKADLKKANVMYMGLMLEAGEHEIELRYETPYLRLGIFASVIGFLLFWGSHILDKRKMNLYGSHEL